MRFSGGRRGVSVLVLVGALLASLAGPAVATTPEERRLAATRAKIAEVHKQMEGVQAQRADRAASLAEANRQVAAVLEAVSAAEHAVQRQEEAVSRAMERLEELRLAEARQRQVLQNRAVTLFKRGTGVSYGAILAADSAEEALRRSSFVDVVNRTDRRRYEGVTVAQVAVDSQRQVLEAEKAALERVAGEQRAVLAEVEAIRQSRAAALSGVSQQLAALQAQERHLESESRQIAALSRRQSRASRSDGAVVPGPTAGGWTWPVRGRVTSEYGPRWGRRHEGIDIGAPTGAAIVAARAGRVTYTGRMGGYGLLTLIDHGGGVVTAYAHQSRMGVRTGQQVGVGERIGSVGCTGSCTGPHLHFEVRVNGSPRNPRQYLP